MPGLRVGELARYDAEKPLDDHVMADVIAAAEATLCQILADVLGLDLVRPQDGFFEVGGDSVRAVQVIARARAAGLVLSVRDLFDHQTAGTLAVRSTAVRRHEADSVRPRPSRNRRC